MRKVAVDADHFLLPHGMVGEQAVLFFYLGVTAEREFGYELPLRLLLWPFVQFFWQFRQLISLRAWVPAFQQIGVDAAA